MFGKKITVEEMLEKGFYDIVFKREDSIDICEATIDCKVGKKKSPVLFVSRIPKNLNPYKQRHKLFIDIIGQYDYYISTGDLRNE